VADLQEAWPKKKGEKKEEGEREKGGMTGLGSTAPVFFKSIPR